jgi:hypothetical protein
LEPVLGLHLEPLAENPEIQKESHLRLRSPELEDELMAHFEEQLKAKALELDELGLVLLGEELGEEPDEPLAHTLQLHGEELGELVLELKGEVPDEEQELVLYEEHPHPHPQKA